MMRDVPRCLTLHAAKEGIQKSSDEHMARFNLLSHQRRAPDVRRSREEFPLHGDRIFYNG